MNFQTCGGLEKHEVTISCYISDILHNNKYSALSGVICYWKGRLQEEGSYGAEDSK